MSSARQWITVTDNFFFKATRVTFPSSFLRHCGMSAVQTSSQVAISSMDLFILISNNPQFPFGLILTKLTKHQNPLKTKQKKKTERICWICQSNHKIGLRRTDIKWEVESILNAKILQILNGTWEKCAGASGVQCPTACHQLNWTVRMESNMKLFF